ncbi:MAG TPA: CHAT domain-containing tetratricopeptide repeat protein, partial [Puia sp.]|nr:CHAT domain-containing tetratricopeptide repeat protein [Puia sp.]
NIYNYLTWKINSLLKLKKYDESAELSEKVLAECQEKGNKEYLGVLYDFLARANAAKGDSRKAVLYSQRSFTYNERIGNYKGCAETLINLGDVLYFKHLHQYNSALRCFNKALRYAITPDSIALFDDIAKVYVEKGLYDSAFLYFGRSFGVLEPGMDEKKLLQSGAAGLVDGTFVEYLVEMILDKGDAYLKKYKSFREKEISEHKAFGATASLRQAIATYATIDQLLDKIRAAQTETFSKLFWRANYRRLYENAIEACYLDDDPRQAFYFFEKSKAALLSDQLSEQHWLNNEEFLKLAQVKRKILQLDRQLSGIPASREPIERELLGARQELARREQLIKKKYPLYYQGFLDTSRIGLRNVQESLLTDHQAFLELFSGDKAVYTLLTDRSGSHLSRIDKHDFDSTLRLYLTALSNPDQLNDHFGDFTKAAGHLYRLIFGDRPLPDGRIIISPDGRFFPFEALVVKNDTRNPVYFLEGHAVSYTYSARYLLNHSDTSPTRVNGDFLGVAPVHYSAGLGLPALPGSEHSLGRIASYFGNTSSLLSEQATRNNFLRQFYGFKIIQLYTHASDGLRSTIGVRSIGDAARGPRDSLGSGATGNRSSLPGTGSVSLGADGNSSDPQIWFADSSLSLTDLIPDSRPVTRLIVLSACETGNGRVYEGEGVFSFNRGFAAIGIPSSVTNLWAVDDQSTYSITELFYHYLSEGMPLDLALQHAKTDYIKNISHERALPYYWAAPILSGDTQAIKFRPAHSLLREILIVLSILGLALLLRWVWKRLNG